MSRVFVVAEAGANHNRNKDVAFELIDAAVQSGADAAKFQTYSANTLYSRFTPNFAGYEDVFNFIKSIYGSSIFNKFLETSI